MKIKNITVYLFSIGFMLTSCSGWTDKEKTQFIEACESQNINREYCDCVLNKAIEKYKNMNEINNDEKAMAEIMTATDCIDKLQE